MEGRQTSFSSLNSFVDALDIGCPILDFSNIFSNGNGVITFVYLHWLQITYRNSERNVEAFLFGRFTSAMSDAFLRRRIFGRCPIFKTKISLFSLHNTATTIRRMRRMKRRAQKKLAKIISFVIERRPTDDWSQHSRSTRFNKLEFKMIFSFYSLHCKILANFCTSLLSFFVRICFLFHFFFIKFHVFFF